MTATSDPHHQAESPSGCETTDSSTAADPAELLSGLRSSKILGIIRGTDTQASIDTVTTLLEAGVSHVEVSLTSADAHTVLQHLSTHISSLSERPAGPAVQIGAGTVLREAEVDTALEHGAQYIVTPALAPSVAYAARLGVPVLAGAMTPTEVMTAMDSGATAVKIFPAGRLGPGYVKDLAAPFPEIPLIPVGGVGAEDVASYLSAGALAVGVASPLCGDAPDGGNLDALRQRAETFLQAVTA